MHIKSKFELNFVHIAVLAVCPLISVGLSFMQGVTILILSVISFLFAALVNLVIFRKSSRNVKIFVVALVASLIATGYELLAKNGTFSSIGNLAYFSILSALVLSIDLIYVDNNTRSVKFLWKMIRILIVYAFVLTVYCLLKELLSFGTVAGKRPFDFYGYEFFKTITFDFILLGLLCALINRITMLLVEVYTDRKMVYNKYKAKVRNEKAFLYDRYRRQRLLSSEVVINKISTKDEDDENQTTDIDAEQSEKEKDKSRISKKSVIKNKPKTKRKLKVSKEAKVERLFDRKGTKEGN